MTTQAIREYLDHVWKQYKRADKKTKSQILDEISRNLGVHRKSAVRLLSKKYPPRSMQGFRGGRKKKYSHAAKQHLAHLWHAMVYMCPERMKAALPDWLTHYDHKECGLEVKQELLRMSKSSIRRFLAPERAKLRRKMNTGTKKGVSRFKTIVPVRNLGEKPAELGHCEIDCVAHCGGSLSGEFVWSLTLTDILSGWTECEAVWAKTGFEIRRALKQIEKRLPFALKSLYVDNGSEFLNEIVIEKFAKEGRSVAIQFFRSRPYHKNDQAYVEQKNYTHIRHLLGYGRIDWQPSVTHMNSIYRKEWRELQNFFMPQQRLEHKERQGSKIIRRMSEAQTPFQRLGAYLPAAEYSKLEKTRGRLNPFGLRKVQRLKIRQLNSYYKGVMSRNEIGKAAI